MRNGGYLLPVKVLASRFRTLLCRAVRAAHKAGQLTRVPSDVAVGEAIRKASKQDWIVYAKAPFGGPAKVLEYVSRYTQRVAISNRRIISFTGDRVTFQWRDYSDGNRRKIMNLDAMEFLRRFLMHILPDRFVRIRYFGFLTNAKRRANIEIARRLLVAEAPRPRERVVRRVLCPACLRSAALDRHSWAPEAGLRSPPLENAA